MKKKVLIGIVVVLAIVVVVLAAMAIFKVINENREEVPIGPSSQKQIAKVREQEKILKIPEEVWNEEIQKGGGGADVDYAFDISDTGIIGNLADYIIIGTVENIEGTTNYNPSTGSYSSAKTVGTVKVEKVLKGKIDEEIIPFIKSGGVIPFSEYEKSQPDFLREKQGWDELQQEEKENQYITQMSNDDIFIEDGKTYYMLLTYNTDYERYTINFMKYGLREIDTSNGLNLEDNSKIQVKDNKNGKYLTLRSILLQIENSKEKAKEIENKFMNN